MLQWLTGIARLSDWKMDQKGWYLPVTRFEPEISPWMHKGTNQSGYASDFKGS
jgi:hypothetical protein